MLQFGGFFTSLVPQPTRPLRGLLGRPTLRSEDGRPYPGIRKRLCCATHNIWYSHSQLNTSRGVAPYWRDKRGGSPVQVRHSPATVKLFQKQVRMPTHEKALFVPSEKRVAIAFSEPPARFRYP